MEIVAAKYRVVSGSWFKLLAVISMAIDHTALFILRYIPQYNEPLLLLDGRELSLYALMRLFGRIAFPLFAFFVVEGFIHTRNRRRYALNLAIFALISEIPWQLLHSAPFYATQRHAYATNRRFGYGGYGALLEQRQATRHCPHITPRVILPAASRLWCSRLWLYRHALCIAPRASTSNSCRHSDVLATTRRLPNPLHAAILQWRARLHPLHFRQIPILRLLSAPPLYNICGAPFRIVGQFFEKNYYLCLRMWRGFISSL